MKHLIVDVHILEPQGLKEEAVDYFVQRRNTSDDSMEVLRPEWAEMKSLHLDRASIQFHPSAEEQERLSTSGNLGKFIVKYDVIHGQSAGDIQVCPLFV